MVAELIVAIAPLQLAAGMLRFRIGTELQEPLPQHHRVRPPSRYGASCRVAHMGGEPIGGVHPVSESSMATNNWSSSVSACVIRGDTGENLGAHRHVRFFLLSSKCVLIAEALLPNTSLGAQTGCGGGLPSCFVRLALSPT